MGELIDRIWSNGYAYESEDSIYFDVRKYASENKYGVLSRVEIAQQQSRIDKDEYDREEVQDFALWKAHKEGEPSFEISVNGKLFKGRPGWHIECSAMSIKNLGKTFDIHTGGVDHIFPHHENEIAQAKAANPAEDFVKYWLHAEFMLVDGKKMSKSLGNTYSLDDVTGSEFGDGLDYPSAIDLRFLFLQAHYRTKLNFTKKSLLAAREGRYRLRFDAGKSLDGQMPEWASEYRKEFFSKLENDLDSPGALAVLSKLLREMMQKQDFVGVRPVIKDFEEILQLDLLTLPIFPEHQPNEQISDLFTKREEAREAKDWARSDELRKQIEAGGWTVQDGPEGSKLVPKR